MNRRTLKRITHDINQALLNLTYLEAGTANPNHQRYRLSVKRGAKDLDVNVVTNNIMGNLKFLQWTTEDGAYVSALQSQCEYYQPPTVEGQQLPEPICYAPETVILHIGDDPMPLSRFIANKSNYADFILRCALILRARVLDPAGSAEWAHAPYKPADDALVGTYTVSVEVQS